MEQAEGAVLVRARLEELLEPAAIKPITVIVAGAGYGKSTLIGRRRDHRWVVQSLTAADDTLSSLTRRLVHRLRRVVPTMSDEFERLAGQAVSADLGTQPNAALLAAPFVDELDALVDERLVLVFDGLHVLDAAGPSVAFIEALCRLATPPIHVVVTSRRPIPFALERLSAAGHVTALAAEDLAFDEGEVAEWILRRERSLDVAPQLIARTRGWPAAVVASTARNGGLGERLGATGRGGDPAGAELAGYVAQEVLGDIPASLLAGIEQLAALPWWTADLLAELPGGLGADIDALAAAGVVVAAVDIVDARCVAPIVRDHLLRAGAGDGGRASLLSAAVVAYVSRGEWEAALDCGRRCAPRTPLVSLLREHGREMIGAGLLPALVSALREVDDESLQMLRADVALATGDLSGATARYLAMAPAGGPLPAALAWRAGFARFLDGDNLGALALYERADTHRASAGDRAMLLGRRSGAYFFLGEHARAERMAIEALALAEEADDDAARAAAHTVLALVAMLRGARDVVDREFATAITCAGTTDDALDVALLRNLYAARLLEYGELDAAWEQVTAALRLADLTGMGRRRGMSLCIRARVLLVRGELDEAAADLEEARRIFARVAPALLGHSRTGFGLVHASRGDRMLAVAAFRDAVATVGDLNDPELLVTALSGWARVVAADDAGESRALAQRALATDSSIGRSTAMLALAHAEFAAGDRAAAASWAAAATEVARSRHQRPVLAETLELQAALSSDAAAADGLLAEAEDLWRPMGAAIALARLECQRAQLAGQAVGSARCRDAAEELDRLGANSMARDAWCSAGRIAAGAPVSIRTFGGLEVSVEGVAVGASQWQSRVAREVLAILVTNRPRPVRRADLIDQFWPGDDSPQASNRLSAALSTIRKVLDPHRLGPLDRFLRVERDLVTLVDVEVDLDEFLQLAATGLRSGPDDEAGARMALLRRVESLFRGDYLEEFAYADWATGLRERCRAVYLEVASTLGAASAADGDHGQATRFYLRMLECDRYDERAHIGAIDALRHQGRHESARRMYALYAARMAELGAEPRPFPR
ncbi:MAG: BTAD domain-containing putative transcriptional regulator [Desertimonas sp.]